MEDPLNYNINPIYQNDSKQKTYINNDDMKKLQDDKIR